MRGRRYTFVLLDGRGRELRRGRVDRGSLRVVGGIIGILVLVGVVLLAHALWIGPDAERSRRLAAENEHLSTLLQELEPRIPQLRQLVGRTEGTFWQMSAKSGLGRAPTLVGVGPLDRPENGLPNTDTKLNGRLLALDPIELPLEQQRIVMDGERVLNSLAGLLEYFHDAERLLSNTPSINPTHSPWLTSNFGRRLDPVYGTWMMHKGLDLGGRIGDPVFAPADGVVIWVGRRGGYGNTIVLDHGYGIQTHFAHLSSFKVAQGDQVKRGQQIALMGSTGKSTGPHLHYEVRRMGRPLDPRPFILD